MSRCLVRTPIRSLAAVVVLFAAHPGFSSPGGDSANARGASSSNKGRRPPAKATVQVRAGTATGPSTEAKPDSFSSHKPNFYTDRRKTVASGASKSSTRPKKTAEPPSLTSTKKSTIAGPNSVRRLAPVGSLPSMEASSHTRGKSGEIGSRQVPSSLSASSIPDLTPPGEPSVAVDSSASRSSAWQRLNPLSLFRPRQPKLVPTGYIQTGIASWYGPDFHGGPTASGEPYDMNSLTAAHPSLPFGTLLRVTNLRNGRDVVVRVNNRGPFHRNRIIDLSKQAARELGMIGSGIAKVKVEVLSAVEPIGQWGQQTWKKISAR